MVENKLSSELVYRSMDTLIIVGLLLLVSNYSAPYNMKGYLATALGAVLLFNTVGRFTEIYSSWSGRPFMRDEGIRLIFTWMLTFLLLVFIVFTFKASGEFSRFVLISWLILTPIMLILNRYLLRTLLAKLKSLGINNRTIAIAGVTEQGINFANDIQQHPEAGMQVAGFYTLNTEEIAKVPSRYANMGSIDSMLEAARSGTWDQIYLSTHADHSSHTHDILDKLTDTITPIRLIPDKFTNALLHSKQMEIMNTPIVCIYDEPLSMQGTLIKRMEDLILGSLILLLISPILLLIAAAVKLTSPGPALFKQNRHGLKGETFKVWKFRTMTVCENGDVVKQATRNDMRITKVGAFLRKTSLDELPQFFNVLQGHMSIVGPRPHAVAHNEEYKKLIPGYMMRHIVKPGITGWAQVNGWRGETDTLFKMQKRVEFDMEYINHWSLWLDLKIIFATAFKAFNDKNAY